MGDLLLCVAGVALVLWGRRGVRQAKADLDERKGDPLTTQTPWVMYRDTSAITAMGGVLLALIGVVRLIAHFT